ncbi:polysaccharide biosynthesis protein [Neorhizobium sp. P12A]|uniref:GumC family protein n=1 Tax=Neorhizobium sp. P12A TaxID=2268027 RepID=UPI0011EF8539|nr:polysaccharide biosynthesis tyrosine autokinase [Neorhizobium sp. P12A]KAA0700248.1 polysaccharide biosynthesis protein [Neorhizobium sp. P12A]
MIVSQSPQAQEQESGPRFLSILWERRYVVFQCLILGLIGAAVSYFATPARYKAEAILALDARKLQVLPTESVISPLPQDSPVLRTELDIIGSRSMAERVLDKLSKQDIAAERRANGPGPQPEQTTLDPREKKIKLDKMMDDVRVINDGRSYTIYIDYYATDSVYAAQVANAYGEAYIDYQIDQQTSATRRVSEWLGERLVSLRTKLEESERAANDFRTQAGLVDTGGAPLQSQQISRMNDELTSLQTKMAGSVARLETAEQMQKEGDILGLYEVLSSPSVQALRAEQARVERAIADIDKSGALMNSQLPQLLSQRASLKQQVANEVTQVVNGLRSEIVVNDKQQEALEANLKDIQTAMSKTSQAQVQLSQLDREAAANRVLYESYLSRYKQTIEQDGIATAEARLISRAMPSPHPTSPDAKLWAIAGLVFGILGGIALALLLNFTDKSVRSPNKLEAKLGLAIIGRIPRLSRKEVVLAADINRSAPDFRAAIADLQTYLRLSTERARVVVLTSSINGEGKTFIIGNLARSLAATGVKTAVLECNLRNPTLSKEFALQTSRHLAQFVTEEISADELIQHDPGSDVDIVFAEECDVPPEFILGSRRFATLMEEMKRRYDLVLIDGPTAADGFDLLRVASFSDTVAFVINPDIAKITEVEASIKKLRLTNRPISGIVLNGIRRKRHRSPLFGWLFSSAGKSKRGRKYKPARPVTVQS